MCISGHFMQYPTKILLVNWASPWEGKIPVIAGIVSFHLHLGEISLLFWQLSFRNNIFKLTPTPPCGVDFIHNFLCMSTYFM